MGGKRRWCWVAVVEGHAHDQGPGAPKDHSPDPETDWRYTRPHGTGYKEDFSKPETHDMLVRLDGETSDMIVSQGIWDKGCVEIEGG